MFQKSKLLLVSALLFCLTLSGCVYLRLLEVKNQLAKFDDYFEVEVSDSFTLHLNDPVLYDSDILYITEINPSQIEQGNPSFSYIYRFVKEEKEPTPGNQDLVFTLSFNEEKQLDAVNFSPVILQIVPAEFLELSIRAIGHGKVDRKKRQLRGDVDKVSQEGLEIPAYEHMIRVLGKPYKEVVKHDGLHVLFRYELMTDSKGAKAKNRKKAIIDMRFDNETNQLIKVAGNFAGMKISINYDGLAKSPNSESE